MANYTVDKIKYGSNVYILKDSNALPLTGGSVTGPVIFGDAVTADSISTGDLVVTGSASFANNLQAVTINGVTVGSSPKFTDTITTATTSGSGNAVTAISASNGALTVTKGSTFLTSADISGKIDTAGTGLSKSGTTLNHSNSVTAQTTQNVYPIKIDAQGHISAYGTAITSAAAASGGTTVSLVTTGEKYTWNNKGSGTVTKVSTGAGLTGGDITTTGTIAHSNSVTAQTTQAIYPIKIDAQGHISAYGTAVTPITSHQTIKQDAVTGATGNHYASCTVAAGTAAKTASITAGTPTLEAGLRVSVKFSNANTASTPTLNINSLGAKNIFHKGAQITTGSNKALLAGLVDFIYDGTQWHLVGNYLDTNTTYTGAASNTTGISIANHGTTSITGVSGSVTGSHVKSGGNGTAPTLGTAFTVPNVTAVGSGSFTSGTFSGGSGSFSATVSSHVMSFSHTHTAATHGTDSHTHTAPTLGNAFTIPNVTSAGSASNWVFENVTVPKAASATTVVTGYTHTITDNGHTHTLTTS